MLLVGSIKGSSMARKPRFNLVGVPQHVIQRGNNREPCFFAEADYRLYLDSMQESAAKFGCLIHAYVLMTNHVHLLVTPQVEHGISQMMQSLDRRYVRYINGAYRRTGTLWEGRYKASLIESSQYLLTCMRYIEMNPVRAGMVEVPGEYNWSSYQANGYGNEDDCTTPHPLYLSLGERSDEREHAYRELFAGHLGYQQLHEIREALNQEFVLGSSQFKEKIEMMTNRRVSLVKPGRPKASETSEHYFVY